METTTEQIEVLIFFGSIEALTIEVATKAPTTKMVAEPTNNRSGRRRRNYTRGSTIIKATNCTSISKIQYNTNKSIMVSINRNSQTTKNHHKGKTHINNIIFSNMKTL
jgi:metal-dependent HD superfamily phosphatase/phosphodiesterase